MPLSHAAEVVLGRQRAPQYEEGEGQTPYLRSANIKDGRLDLSDVKSMRFSPGERMRYELRAGDVLVTEGSGSRDSVGASAVWLGELPGPVCFQNTLLRLRPRAGVSGRYLGWWARHAHASGLVQDVATGANILHVGAESMRSLPIALPEFEEQQRIADFLDGQVGLVDAAVATADELHRLAEEHEKAALDDRYAGIASRRGTLPLRRSVRRVDQGWSPVCESSPVEGSAPGVIKLSAIRDGRFQKAENKALPVGETPRSDLRLREGDLLVTRANTRLLVGDAAVVTVTENLFLSDLVYRLVLKSGDPDYFSLMLRAGPCRAHMMQRARGTSQTMVKVRGEDVLESPIPMATETERRIAVAEAGVARGHADDLARASSGLRKGLVERNGALITSCMAGEFDVSSASSRAGDAALAGLSTAGGPLTSMPRPSTRGDLRDPR